MSERKKALPSTEEIEKAKQDMVYRDEYKKTVRSTVAVLVVVAAVAVLVASLLVPVAQVTGESMEPSLYNGDVILLFKTSRFKTGDLCCFAYQNKLLIKRVIGNPGDIIEISTDGTVSVNGRELDEPYISEKSRGECDLAFPYQVPENRYFLIGDHRSTSIDSRSSVIGCVPKEQVIGKVFFRIWPLADISFVR